MSTIRQEQVQIRLVQEISEMLRRDLKDPRLGFVTVTAAEISRDLRSAKVYVSVMGTDDERNGAIAALRSATGLIRGEFTRRQHLRVAPEIEFRFDTGIARGSRIFELLKEVERTTPNDPEPPASSPGDPNGE